MKKMMLLASALLMGAMASAQVQINEMLINGPGADNGDEFIELRGAAGLNLDGYWFLSVEGDGTAAGSIDQAIPLAGLTLGSNGLLLIRDLATSYNSVIAPETTVLTIDFNPDLENGSNSYLLVQGYTGYVINANTNAGQNGPAAATDIDQNNDGVVGDVANNDGSNPTNVLPWTSVVDAVGWTDAASDWAYANQLGFNANFLQLNLTGGAGGASNLVGDAFVRLDDGTLVATDLAADSAGSPFGTQFTTLNGSVDAAFWTQQSITPGAANPVPEPGTIGALGLGAVALLRRRRRK